jgi:hypothetical protein
VLNQRLFSCMIIITDWCERASAHSGPSQYRVRGNIASIASPCAGSEQASKGNEVEGRAPRATEADQPSFAWLGGQSLEVASILNAHRSRVT